MSSHYHAHNYLPPPATKCPVGELQLASDNNDNKSSGQVKRFNQQQVSIPKGIKSLDQVNGSANFNGHSIGANSTYLTDDQTNFSSLTSTQIQIQRKLLKFFLIYAILIISLYVTYAAYYYYQHNYWLRKSASLNPISGQEANLDEFIQHNAINFKSSSDSMTITKQRLSSHESGSQVSSAEQLTGSDLELSKLFESKLHLLERYIEVIALDLQETKTRLKEREKCDCSMSCTFNGTKFADHSTWQNQCDTCTCQSGRISCQPIQCPALNCEDSVILAGQCCPTCMRKCSHNNTLIRHGVKFNPHETNSNSTSSKSLPRKECKCDDGRIKCVQLLSTTATSSTKKSANNKVPLPQADINNSTSGAKAREPIKRQAISEPRATPKSFLLAPRAGGQVVK